MLLGISGMETDLPRGTVEDGVAFGRSPAQISAQLVLPCFPGAESRLESRTSGIIWNAVLIINRILLESDSAAAEIGDT